MITNQVILHMLEELKAITRADLAVYDESGNVLARTVPDLVSRELITDFAASPADSQVVGGIHLLRVAADTDLPYFLAVGGGTMDPYLVGRIAASELSALITAYKDRYDRSHFFQNLLLDNLLRVDIYNQAKKLHLSESQPRIVYLIEVKNDEEDMASQLLREIYGSRGRDVVTSIDEDTIILIRELTEDTSPEAIEDHAHSIVSAINTEAMLSARVAYGSLAPQITDLSKSYKEARMALEVGRIFYAERTVNAYASLGIGRLIYQLPESLCEAFLHEIFGPEMPKELDEDTRSTLKKFFENNLNVSETARQLFVHRNTLVYKIDKVQKATGLDLRNFDDALTYQIAMMVESYLNDKKSRP
ncbi:MAG: helix-turn-helix domain-containing protein [Lachnospiraceae bacterium]|nr:helix-turn-helix domain-containing protein [Lachnospiraceae bacterium]